MSARRWLPFLLWSAVVLTLTSIPNPNVPAVPGGDKAAHAIMYGASGALAGYALASAARPARAHLVAWLGIAALAAVDEWHQRYIPGRSADVADWTADVLGAAFALTCSLLALRRRELD